MVIKPAEQTPLSALAIGELSIEAGVPAGVVGIITGDAEPIARAMLSSPIVRKLSFTGSTEVGRILMRQSADNLVRLSLELGGHAPFIVFADADLDTAVAAAVANKLRNGGQTCICANRFIIERPVAPRFAELLGRAMSAVKVGRGTDDGVQVGPLIDDRAMEKVEAHVADAVSKGANVMTGGRRADPGPGLANRFYCPTVLSGCTQAMRIATEETFGPVAPIFVFDSENEAVRMANDTEYGLAAYFFTRDASRIFRVAEALEYGIVGVNDATPSTPQAPFGGVKHSGFGREGGRHVMDEYTDMKFVSWRT
jgi:succinate-semialdehyde dehydrogenase/glutarate-semialdehyde dehydrogenase